MPPDSTGPQQKPQLFKPGQSGNPAGRPKGSRQKLATSFLDAILETFNEPDASGQPAGISAIRKVREEDPATYTKVIASLMPKELTGEDGGPIIARIERVIIDPSRGNAEGVPTTIDAEPL